MKKLKNWLGPFLFTLFPTLVIYAHNIDQLSLDRLNTPLIYSILLFIVSSCVAFALLRSSQKASILTSLWILLFFSYGYVYLYLGSLPLIASLPLSVNKILLSAFLIILITFAFLLAKTKKSLANIIAVLNLVSFVLILLNLLTIIPFEIKRSIGAFKLKSYIKNQLVVKQPETQAILKPDIYYIIFDRYGRQDVLQKYLNFDNQKNINFLQENGFFVAENSYANYPNTFLSLSSSLNITHLDFLSKNLGANQNNRTNVYHQLIENNQVAQFLKWQGYKYVISGSFWDPTKVNGISDEGYNLFADFDEFHLFIYERTLLNTIRGLIEGKQLYTGIERLNKLSLNLDYRLAKIKKLDTQPQPVFLFAHFLMPHDPTIMSSECEPLSFEEIRHQSEEEGYLNELQCANTVMQVLVDKIQANSDRPAVIIFQSDEGSYLPAKYFNQNGKLIPESLDSYVIHSAVFNSIYLPAKENTQKPANYEALGLDKNSSPVNTFRIIFNYYFGTNLPLLENKTYIFKDESHPYQFIDLTPELIKSF